jgi:diadenosine tetraphosphate (Ap4A) HIT family hydrolase
MGGPNIKTNDSCLFCSIPEEQVIASNELAYAIKDSSPVTEGHALIIPKRHVADYFGLSDSEILACNRLIKELQESIIAQDPLVAGFNIGMNAGAAAGQTIFHCHIHLIPRREGDVENPRGGVRHVISGKGYY